MKRSPPKRRHGLLLVLSLLSACSAVHVRDVRPQRAAVAEHGDVLTTGDLSAPTRAALLLLGLDAGECAKRAAACVDAVAASSVELDDEARLAALAELQLLSALTADRGAGATQNSRARSSSDPLESYVSAARSSYAYLFFTRRDPAERAFEDRQTQVRGFYNRATERAAELLFERRGRTVSAETSAHPIGAKSLRGGISEELSVGSWRVRLGTIGTHLPGGEVEPARLAPASRLELDGLRNTYRRDGFGAPFVAVGAMPAAAEHEAPHIVPALLRPPKRESPLVEPRFVAATVVLRFPGDTLAAVLATHDAILDVHDPYSDAAIRAGAYDVPLAANFTAPYALWLDESHLARDSRLALLKPDAALRAPRIYLMQPYDPNRRTVVLLHGLGSSPEAWVNLVNEIMGDAELRARYQIWQVFYPTNLPIPENRRLIHAALLETLQTLDPSGAARASEHVTLVGHSMGGVLAHLLLVESGDVLWQELFAKPIDPAERERYALLAPYLDLHPLPQVDEAIFLAAPHRGSPLASDWLGRVGAAFVRLPVSAVQTLGTVADALVEDVPVRAAALRQRRNSVTNLSDHDDYLNATAELPIAPGVTYHTIVGRHDPSVPLEQSSDGVVPYKSSHLDGAASELVVPSRHGLQDTPQAILEIRRLLRDKPI